MLRKPRLHAVAKGRTITPAELCGHCHRWWVGFIRLWWLQCDNTPLGYGLSYLQYGQKLHGHAVCHGFLIDSSWPPGFARKILAYLQNHIAIKGLFINGVTILQVISFHATINMHLEMAWFSVAWWLLHETIPLWKYPSLYYVHHNKDWMFEV